MDLLVWAKQLCARRFPRLSLERRQKFVLCRESTQSFCLNVSGHDDQIRHERVHGEAHSASAFLVREAIFVNKVCWWYVCDVSLAAHGKVSKLIGAPPGYVWILVFRSPFWRNPNEFLSFTSLECEENAFFYLLVWNMVWSLHILYHYSLFNMKSFYTMFFFHRPFRISVDFVFFRHMFISIFSGGLQRWWLLNRGRLVDP